MTNSHTTLKNLPTQNKPTKKQPKLPRVQKKPRLEKQAERDSKLAQAIQSRRNGLRIEAKNYGTGFS